MKFGDIVICVASITVILALVEFPLELLFVSAGLGFETGTTIGSLISFFISALIGGYIFAGKIWEARREAITKITVLWTALVSLLITIVPATVAHWSLVAEESFPEMFPGTSWTSLSNAERMSFEMLDNAGFLFVVVAIALVFSFIGLYIGSMVRKPKQS